MFKAPFTTPRQRRAKAMMVNRSHMQMARRAAKDFAVGGDTRIEARIAEPLNTVRTEAGPSTDSNSIDQPQHPTVECANCHSASERVYPLGGLFVCRVCKSQSEVNAK